MAATPTPRPLTVLTGPSGVGKGTLVQLLRQRHPQLWLSVSATTRPPRPGEQEGVHYFFHSPETFEALVEGGGLLEWARFAGNGYGTPRAAVEERLARGIPVLLEIELEGARQVRRHCPEAFQVFVRPPSLAELERRIRGRGTDSEEAIVRRLARAEEELQAEPEFDAVVVNHELPQAVADLERLMGLEVPPVDETA
ncbi:MAG: guanylate kinase [Cyanobacteriota bacterium]|nr:guanylate kinase [Cyanobacteriota bacterium]